MNRPAAGHRLSQRQSQSAILSPALHQAIKLLQLTATELDQVVREALEANPFLLQETETERPPERTTKGAPRAGRRGGALAPDPALARMLGARFAERGRRTTSAPTADSGHAPAPDMARTESLRDYVAREAAALFESAEDRRLAMGLADSLDEAGYLTEPLPGIAADLGVEETRLEAALKRLQEIDPPGLFARDLAECLRLQLADRGELDAPMQALLDNLDMLAAGDFDRLADRCGVGRDALDRMVAQLRTLDPRPGLAFETGEAVTVVPDLVVSRVEGGGETGAWRVTVNPALAPRLFIDRQYYDAIRAAAGKDDKAYLSEQLRSAHWLIRALDQRGETMLAVAEEIVRRQSAFLERGVEALEPMVLREVAETLSLHESTVSRAIAGKHIETPRGVLELRDFFSTAIPDTGGGPPRSARAAKARLKALIESEGRPLSDARLAELLRDEGFDLARRTVAKYREELGLPASSKRRRPVRTTPQMAAKNPPTS